MVGFPFDIVQSRSKKIYNNTITRKIRPDKRTDTKPENNFTPKLLQHTFPRETFRIEPPFRHTPISLRGSGHLLLSSIVIHYWRPCRRERTRICIRGAFLQDSGAVRAVVNPGLRLANPRVSPFAESGFAFCRLCALLAFADCISGGCPWSVSFRN